MSNRSEFDRDEESSAARMARPLFERVAEYLDANNWKYSANREEGYFSSACKLLHCSARLLVDVSGVDSGERVLVYTCLPIYVPETRRSAVAEAITRINFDIVYGNLEMGYEDGEVRMRTVAHAHVALQESAINHAIDINLSTANRYFASIAAVAFGGLAPSEILDVTPSIGDALIQ